MIITEPRIERFRTIQPQRFFSFPNDINPMELKVHSYDFGRKCKTLTISHFESISFLGWYYCPINKSKFIKAIGLNNKNLTILWLTL